MTDGKVYLVGAGPGDPELLTVKARRCLDGADVVLHDALAGTDIVDTVPPSTHTVDVGKRPDDGERTTQAEINRAMIERARAGATVVRLKGGDPTVYGRGGEEAEALADANVPFEIVPGVTSAIAAPAVVGIPLTHREHASSVTVITGHEAAKEESALDWDALGRMIRSGGTLVIMMGVRTLPRTVRRLRDAGVDGDVPAATIERATWTDEATVTGTLETIDELASATDISPPAVTVIGDVVTVRDAVESALERDDAAVASAVEEEVGEHAPVSIFSR